VIEWIVIGFAGHAAVVDLHGCLGLNYALIGANGY
jgi:hypothetical protein